MDRRDVEWNEEIVVAKVWATGVSGWRRWNRWRLVVDCVIIFKKKSEENDVWHYVVSAGEIFVVCG